MTRPPPTPAPMPMMLILMLMLAKTLILPRAYSLAAGGVGGGGLPRPLDDSSSGLGGGVGPSASTTSPRSFRVGIAGAGSVACGTACLLSSMGHDPMIWSPSLSSSSSSSSSSSDDIRDPPADAAADAAATGGTRTTRMRSSGALEGDFDVRVAKSARDLVDENDGVLILALPANGHRSVMERLVPHVVDRLLTTPPSSSSGSLEEGGDEALALAAVGGVAMHVIISSHASLGAVYLMGLLREECLRRVERRRRRCGEEGEDGADDDEEREVDEIMGGVRITAWGTTVVTARRTSGTSLRVPTVRGMVDACTVPSRPPPAETTATALATALATTTTATATAATMTRTKRELLLDRDGLGLCAALFGPRFRNRRGGLLAISLSNLNPQNHLGIVLGNMSRMDPPPPPPPPPQQRRSLSAMDDATEAPSSSTAAPSSSSPPWPSWYQGENVTPNVGRLMEALDRERLDIARELEVDVRTIREHYSWSFGIPMDTPVVEDEADEDEEDDVGDGSADGDESFSSSLTTKRTAPKTRTATRGTRPLTVSEMNQYMHHHLDGVDVHGPATPDTRYVLEDVPYGLATTVLLGRMVGRPAILHESGMRILSAMYGRDFINENELFRGLGLLPPVVGENVNDDGCSADREYFVPSLDRWREMAYSGSF